jgi:hypothetical protein
MCDKLQISCIIHENLDRVSCIFELEYEKAWSYRYRPGVLISTLEDRSGIRIIEIWSVEWSGGQEGAVEERVSRGAVERWVRVVAGVMRRARHALHRWREHGRE